MLKSDDQDLVQPAASLDNTTTVVELTLVVVEVAINSAAVVKVVVSIVMQVAAASSHEATRLELQHADEVRHQLLRSRCMSCELKLPQPYHLYLNLHEQATICASPFGVPFIDVALRHSRWNGIAVQEKV